MAYREKRDREYDDRRGGRSERDRDDKRPALDSERRPERSRAANLNEFFVDGEGIEREVLQKEICRFLGPEAYSKPKRYNGVDGYSIKAVRTFTPDMLEDLQRLSKNYASESREMARRGRRGFTYGDSETSRRQDTSLRDEDDDGLTEPSGYPPGPSYSTAPPQYNGYSNAPQYPAGSGYASSPYTSMPPQSSGYPVPSSYGITTGPPRPIDAHHAYGTEYPIAQESYGNPSGVYAQPPPRGMPMDPYSSNSRMHIRDARPEPRRGPSPDPYGGISRMNIRDTRPEPPRGMHPDSYVSDPRMHMRDPRQDPQSVPRAALGYSQPSYGQSSYSDVQMGGMGSYNEYPSGPAPMQSDRMYIAQDPRALPLSHGRDRNSPGFREYRHEPPREEQRRRDRDRR